MPTIITDAPIYRQWEKRKKSIKRSFRERDILVTQFVGIPKKKRGEEKKPKKSGTKPKSTSVHVPVMVRRRSLFAWT